MNQKRFLVECFGEHDDRGVEHDTKQSNGLLTTPGTMCFEITKKLIEAFIVTCFEGFLVSFGKVVHGQFELKKRSTRNPVF